ncbi:hypothetical protein DPMN_066187 [Dreissena polymorpha]|uniref:Uncharacterized protein n=1 Tax=Dreissena polymorpha TaxID=45954 RepID=A0A9D3YXX3_DREPO|nr:hypothetical protein DPMN_066187 [Dreissena polymorpha]
MEAIIREAVARSALNNYTQNVKKLVDMFSKSTNAVQEAKTFFDAHRIYYKVTNLKRDVEHCYFELVREIIVEGRSEGPMHVELFGEVLNCYIIQHDGDGCFDESAMDSETLSNTPIQKQCQDIIDKISKPSLFSGKECLNMIEYGVSWDFDSLKTVRICKPKETVAINTAIAPGFTAYEKPGNEPVCVYEWISRVYEGTDRMKFIVRLAAARFAMENFNKYITMARFS